MNRRALALVLLLAGSVSAQGAGGMGGAQGDAFKALQFISKAEMSAAAGAAALGGRAVGSAIVRTLPRVVRAVSYAGVISVAPELISDALNYFYSAAYTQVNGTESRDVAAANIFQGKAGGLEERVSPWGSAYPGHVDSRFYSFGTDHLQASDYFSQEGMFQIDGIVCGNYINSFTGHFGDPAFDSSITNLKNRINSCNGYANLGDFLAKYPYAEAATNAAVRTYMADHPEAVLPLITFSPAPSLNQVAGAVLDPAIDSNGDGIPDGVAAAAGVDPGDPAKHPDLTATEASVTNPDGSVTLTRTTYDPNGTPHVTTTTYTPGSVPLDVTNPDGSKTHTVTVTAPDGTVTVTETTTVVTSSSNPDGSQTETTTVTTVTTAKNLRGELTGTSTVTTSTTRNIPKETVCPEDQVKGVDGQCAPKPVDPANLCNDFSIPRLLAHTFSYLKDLFVPCADPGDLTKPLQDAVLNKFPFSMTSHLGKMVSASGVAGDQSAVLPNKIGPFVMDWSWIAPLVFSVGLLFKAAISFLAINFVLSRLSGQVVLK